MFEAKQLCRIVLLLSTLSLGGGAVSAQTFYLEPMPNDRPTVGLSFQKPNLPGETNESFFSGTYDVYCQIPTSDDVGLRFLLPFTHVGYSRTYYLPGYGDYYTSGSSSSAIGNLYLGLYFTSRPSETKRTVTSLGLHFPTANDKDYWVHDFGTLTDYYQARRTLYNAWIILANIAWRLEEREGAIAGFEIGPEAWIPEPSLDADPELLFHYGLSGGAGTHDFAFLAELTGLAIATESNIDFGDRFQHFLAFGFGLRNRVVRPTFWFQVPLHNDMEALINGVIGIKVEIVAREP